MRQRRRVGSLASMIADEGYTDSVEGLYEHLFEWSYSKRWQLGSTEVRDKLTPNPHRSQRAFHASQHGLRGLTEDQYRGAHAGRPPNAYVAMPGDERLLVVDAHRCSLPELRKKMMTMWTAKILTSDYQGKLHPRPFGCSEGPGRRASFQAFAEQAAKPSSQIRRRGNTWTRLE